MYSGRTPASLGRPLLTLSRHWRPSRVYRFAGLGEHIPQPAEQPGRSISGHLEPVSETNHCAMSSATADHPGTVVMCMRIGAVGLPKLRRPITSDHHPEPSALTRTPGSVRGEWAIRIPTATIRRRTQECWDPYLFNRYCHACGNEPSHGALDGTRRSPVSNKAIDL